MLTKELTAIFVAIINKTKTNVKKKQFSILHYKFYI
jgi:hypothetical protein